MNMRPCPKLLSNLAECIYLVGKVAKLPLPLASEAWIHPPPHHTPLPGVPPRLDRTHPVPDTVQSAGVCTLSDLPNTFRK